MSCAILVPSGDHLGVAERAGQRLWDPGPIGTRDVDLIVVGVGDFGPVGRERGTAFVGAGRRSFNLSDDWRPAQ